MTHPLTSFAPTLAGPPRLAPSDVSYVLDDTAVGRMLLAVTSDGALVTCAYAADDDAEQRWLQRLADAVSPRVLRHPAPTDLARRALEEYLAGRSRRIEVPVVSSTKTSANAPPRRRATVSTSSTSERSSMAAMLTGGTVSARG